jgi:tetratricopeptide (TPR) repeat protein
MKRPQWITAGIALVLVIGLYAATTGEIFGNKKKLSAEVSAVAPAAGVTIDSILLHAKENLSQDQARRLSFLEKSISRGDVAAQQIHIYHQLARFWSDTARIFEPYAWYTAESARLENSEKSLTFAAHLFLDNLRVEENPELKQWKALQAKDLFERSLRVNPANDSSEVGLGATYLFGGIESPMAGIQKIRKVADEHPYNIYALMTLGHASVISGQLDKAIERFMKVVQLQPANTEAVILLAEVYEQKGDKTNAMAWYKKSLPLVHNIPGLTKEIEQRIDDLSRK